MFFGHGWWWWWWWRGETGLVDCWIFWIGCFGCRYIRTQLVIALLIYLYLTLSDQSKQTSGSYSMSKSLPGRPTRRRPGRRDYELVDTTPSVLTINTYLYLHTTARHSTTAIHLNTYQPQNNSPRTNPQISWQQHHVFPSPMPQSHSGEQTSTPSTHTDPQKNYLLTVTFSSSVQVMRAHPLSIIS